ncbi:ammonium transporter [Singulisphaera sp. PoT]|uniref:ammonium transporter n=1 Tax=Singulisphaera sp. PoT TaxID=3411797 RepID=UPI003BF57FD8
MNKEIVADLSWGLGTVVVALGATLARKLGYIDGETVTRLVIGMNGLMIIHFGNRIPKPFVPSLFARRVKRVGGWAMVLSGVVYTALFAFAPIPLAAKGGVCAILAGFAVTVGYGLWLRSRAKAA